MDVLVKALPGGNALFMSSNCAPVTRDHGRDYKWPYQDKFIRHSPSLSFSESRSRAMMRMQ